VKAESDRADRIRGVIQLPRAIVEEIVEHARAEAPNEACGIIAGRDAAPERLYRMRNAEESRVSYRFDGKEQLRVFREIEDRGWDLVAFYHSHPHTEAYPSPTDRARAHWRDPTTGREVPAYPGTAYVIASLLGDEDGEPVIRAFRFEDGEPREEEVVVR
jgi:[CysO sulfur-carrier protein]-S-L-cysteine hydrolase